MGHLNLKKVFLDLTHQGRQPPFWLILLKLAEDIHNGNSGVPLNFSFYKLIFFPVFLMVHVFLPPRITKFVN
jgi:hypothetical protein